MQSALLRPFLHLHFLPSADCRHKKYSIQSSGGRGKNSARERDNPSAHFEQNVPTALQKRAISGTLIMPTRSGGSQQMRIKPWQLLTKALLTYFSVIKYKWKHPILNLAIYTSSPGMVRYAPPRFDTKHSLVLHSLSPTIISSFLNPPLPSQGCRWGCA